MDASPDLPRYHFRVVVNDWGSAIRASTVLAWLNHCAKGGKVIPVATTFCYSANRISIVCCATYDTSLLVIEYDTRPASKRLFTSS